MPGRDAATVRELLAQAPPGELRNVASDVRALLGDEQVQTPLPLQNGRARASRRERLADGIKRPPASSLLRPCVHPPQLPCPLSD